MTNNNISRFKAKELAAALGWKKVGNGNFFRTDNGELINITMCGKKIESRQFRKDCTHLVVMSRDSDDFEVYNKGELTIGALTRVGPDGTKYYQANKN